MTPFTNPKMELMLDALADAVKDIPQREILKKLLQLQFERDTAVRFADTFCGSTGNITDLVNEYADFRNFLDESH